MFGGNHSEANMIRARFAVVTLALLTTLSPLTASAHQDLPDRIDLPNGWRPEGITTDGKFLYAGSLADGAIWRANPRKDDAIVLAEGAPGRVAVGIDYDRRRDVLWVAGGDTSEIRAHDADTGDLLATYSFPDADGRFLNDLVVTRRAVYATDSVEANQELAVVKLRHGKRLPGPQAAMTRPLTGDLHYVAGFNLNGIVASHHKLLAIQSNTGLLFRINPRTGTTRTVDLDGDLLTNGDGLELDGDLLYVVQNQDNQIAPVELECGLLEGDVEDPLTAESLDVPTTVALLRHSLWAVNARFNTPPTPDTEYWVTRLDEAD